MIQKRFEIENDHRSQKERDKHNDKEEKKDNEDNISKYSKKNEFEDDVQTLKNYLFLFFNTDRIFEMHALM